MPALHPVDLAAPDPSLERIMRRVALTGVLLVMALPMARMDSIWVGALPLWLIGMPLASWWALHHFRLPRFEPSNPRIKSRRRMTPQARRRSGARCLQRPKRAG